MNPTLSQLENDSLSRVIDDFLDALESIGIEANIYINRKGGITVLFQNTSIPPIKNKYPLWSQTLQAIPEDDILNLDALLKGEDTLTQMNSIDELLTMQNNAALPDEDTPRL